MQVTLPGGEHEPDTVSVWSEGATAEWNGAILAQTHNPLYVIAGMVYFPRADVLDIERRLLPCFKSESRKNLYTTECCNKGTCYYYHVRVSKTIELPGGAFSYPKVLPGGPPIDGQIAFWCGVRVLNHANGVWETTKGRVDSIHCGTVGSESMCNKPLTARSSILEKKRLSESSFCGIVRFYSRRVPTSTGGISLNIIALRSWVGMFAQLISLSTWPEHANSTLSNCSDVMYGNSSNASLWHCDDATLVTAKTSIAESTFKLLLVIVCTYLVILNVVKVCSVPDYVCVELTKPGKCGGYGALLMSISLLLSESSSLGLFCVGSLQIMLVLWLIYILYTQGEPASPSTFPSTVGIGMASIAGSNGGLMPLWWNWLTAAISGVCLLVFFPMILYNVYSDVQCERSAGIFIMAAPCSLFSLVYYSVVFNNWSSDLNIIMGHVVWTLATASVLVALHLGWRRRRAIFEEIYRSPTYTYIHHTDAGITFPLVAYSSATIYYAVRIQQGSLIFVIFSWIAAIFCIAVVCSTDLLFLTYLPRWIRHGNPPVNSMAVSECKLPSNSAEIELVEVGDARSKPAESASTARSAVALVTL